MKTTEQTKVKIEEGFSFFNDSQIEAIKLIIRSGFWGDCSELFNDESFYAHVYYTNMNKGKKWSGKLSGISKTIKSSGTNLISMCSDWWGDGSGDMMFFNMELIDENELRSWAKEEKKTTEQHTEKVSHTKGEWKADLESWKNQTALIECNDVCIAKVLTKNSDGITAEQMEANAKLIAAAPELLEALKHMLKFTNPNGADLGWVESVIKKATE